MFKVIAFAALLYIASGIIVYDNQGGNSYALTNYLINVYTDVYGQQVGDNLVVKYLHPKPPTSIMGFSITVKRVHPDTKSFIENRVPTLISDDFSLGIQVSFPTVLATQNGCVVYDTLNHWFIRKCTLELSYYSQAQTTQTAKIYYSNLFVWIPRGHTEEYKVNGDPIYKNSTCGCTLIPDIEYEATIYDQSCNTALGSRPNVVYGQHICIKLAGISPIIAGYYLKPTSLFIKYKKDDNSEGSESIRSFTTFKTNLAANGPEMKNQIYAIVQLLFVGEVRFELSTILSESRRLLAEGDEPQGFIADLGTVNIQGGPAASGDTVEEESFSASTFVSALTFLAMLMVIL